MNYLIHLNINNTLRKEEQHPVKTEFILFNQVNGNSVNNKVDNKNKKNDSNFSDFLARKIGFDDYQEQDKIKTSLHKAKDSSYSKDNNYNKIIEDKITRASRDKFTKAEFERLAILFQETKHLIVEEVSLSLNITQEELEEMLETLGFESLDLLIQGNATNLFLYVNKEVNLLNIITDESLTAEYTSFMEVIDKKEESLSKDMWQLIGFEDGDIQAIISDLTAKDQALDFNMIFEAISEHIESQTLDNNVDGTSQEQSLEGQIIYENNSNEDQFLQGDYNSDTSFMKDNNSNQQIENREVHEMNKTNDQKDSEIIDLIVDNQKPDKEQSNQTLDQAKNNGLWNSLSNNLNISNNDIIATDENPVHGIFDITKQIIEQIKVRLQGDQTSIEMQLYPEHLGKLAFQVSSKNGILTANIMTQNEVTKEAVENQLHILKEQLSLQGLKVEDIEVEVGISQFFNNDTANPNSNRSRHNQGRKNISNTWIGNNEEDMMNDVPLEDLLISYIQDDINTNTVNYSA